MDLRCSNYRFRPVMALSPKTFTNRKSTNCPGAHHHHSTTKTMVSVSVMTHPVRPPAARTEKRHPRGTFGVAQSPAVGVDDGC
jgi:hypothetical protein